MQEQTAGNGIMKEGQGQEPKPKRTAKDTVFTSLFRDKGYLLQLYQALHPEDKDTQEKDLTIVTLENIMAGGIYNDLGFKLNDKLIFIVEAQSTWTMNILVRVLMYLAKSYQDYIIRTKQDVYGSKKVELPKPELYVILFRYRDKMIYSDISVIPMFSLISSSIALIQQKTSE